METCARQVVLQTINRLLLRADISSAQHASVLQVLECCSITGPGSHSSARAYAIPGADMLLEGPLFVPFAMARCTVHPEPWASEKLPVTEEAVSAPSPQQRLTCGTESQGTENLCGRLRRHNVRGAPHQMAAMQCNTIVGAWVLWYP